MSNPPFSITFGKEPTNYIDRYQERERIIEDFSNETPYSSSYLLLGCRGSGKTVLLSTIASHFKNQEDWIVVDPGSKENMLADIASKIYEKGKMRRLFLESSWSFSFHGFGISIKGKNPISSVKVLLDEMLKYLKKHGKKVLITIDEVDNSDSMKSFLSDYQLLLRDDYDVRLLMTGLYENVSSLMENRSLTFLYRCPSIQLGPLDMAPITSSYMELLDIDKELALSLAKQTKGFAFAFQLLGYLFYESKEKKITSKLLAEYDRYLAQYIYDKTFADMSPAEKKIVFCLGSMKPVSVKDICQKSGFSIKYLGVYRAKLIKKGILVSPKNGYLAFALPRFDEYLSYQDEDLFAF